MKTIKLKSAATCAAILLSFLPKAENLGNLPDLSKPYLGFYECKSVRLGGEELTDCFEYIRIELTRENEIILYYKDKFGRKGEKTLPYRYDEQSKSVVLLYEENGETKEKRVPIENGVIFFTWQQGDKLLTAKFSK